MNNVRIMTASMAALVAILGHEGYRTRSYLDEGGVQTCGVGDTHACDQAPQDPQQAAAFHFTRYFMNIEATQRGMQKCLRQDVPLPQQTWDAFVSFAFNIGTNNFCRSTLAKLANQGDLRGACAELQRWVYTPAGRSDGLVKRRAREYRLCLEGVGGAP